MAERVIQKCSSGLRKIPSWLWRLFFSFGFGYTAIATVVPWAQAQRGYFGFGGEFVLVLVAFALPLCIFRR